MSQLTAAAALVIGSAFGMAGTFAPSASLRAVLWGIDGTALVLASALLTVRYFRLGNDLAAAGFLVFVAGETLILSGVAMDLVESAPTFAAGAALWAASLVLVGASGVMPRWVSVVGFIGALLFAIVALQIFAGQRLTPLSMPLPFFAYPFLVGALLGWAWQQHRDTAPRGDLRK